MKTFRIMRFYDVLAEDRKQAIELFDNALSARRENNFFQFQIVKEKDDPYKGVFGKIKKYTGY